MRDFPDKKTRKTKNPDGSVKYSFFDADGDFDMTVYQLFPGIKLTYHSVHHENCFLGSARKGNLVEFHHCREGRIERHFGNDFFYMMPGDLSVNFTNRKSHKYHFPLRHYHGITVSINLDIAPKCFSCYLRDVDVQPEKVARKLCGNSFCFVARSEDYIEHIFSELYSAPEECKIGYFKVKVLELLLMLNSVDPIKNGVTIRSLSEGQVELAKKASRYLLSQPEEKYTIAQLATKFNVSQTHLQNSFKAVYGVPVSSYMRIQKMNHAAQMLVNTDLPVIEISGICGYDNASKFSSAFKNIIGELPLEYRKAHRIT